MNMHEIFCFTNSENPDINLFIQFYTNNIVRFFYGEKIKKSITKAVILHPEKYEAEKNNNLIISKFFDIEINNNLLIKIKNKKSEIILEDKKIEFHKKKNYKNKMSDFDNFDEINETIEKTYALEINRKHLWEDGFYGMGEKYGFINLLDRYIENWNTDVIGITTAHQSVQKEYHTSIPFYIGMNKEKSYGLYYDNSYRNYFDFKKFSDNISFKTDGGNLDYYFIYGDKVSDVVENYSKLTGTVKLPRKDFLGYQQCRWSYMNTEEVLDIANNMRKNNVPCDVIYLDIDYMQDYKVFTINSTRFKEFKKMIEKLHEIGFKLVVIIDPGVKTEEKYEIYEEGLKNNYFIKDNNGEVYVGKVWPGKSCFPDFSREKVRLWWGELHKKLTDSGVDGIWNDMNEIADMSNDTKTVPESTYHIDDENNKIFQKEFHNLYGHYEAISTYNGLKTIQNTRPFVLTRAASAGTQRYSALWTGDNSSVWEHLESSIPMLLNLGLSGYSYVGSDIGGFLDDTTKELLIRWTQLGIFYPLCRNHSVINSIQQEPWAFDKETLSITRKFIQLRYSLIDHLYNLFRESSIKGTPIIRPLFYHYQNDYETFNINDEFLFGDNILVAPIIRPKLPTRLIYLPEGTWIDYFSGKKYQGKKYIVKKAELNEIPLFIKEGSVILKNKKMNFINENNFNKEIHIYPGNNFNKEFYFDDGISFDYEKENYSLLHIKLEDNILTIEKVKNDYETGNFDLFIHINNNIKTISNIKFNEIFKINIYNF